MEPTDNQNFSGILLCLTHQFLREMNLWSTCHEFEREYAIYFDMDYFIDLIRQGSWNGFEHYLGGFTTFQSNDFSMKLFFEIRKQKYLETLDKGDRDQANAILQKDLKDIIGPTKKDLFDQLHFLLLLNNFRSHFHLRDWVDVPTSRNILIKQLPDVIKANPDLNRKLILPQAGDSTLVALARQSLEAQYAKCQCPRDQWSLLGDHQCPHSSAAFLSVNSTAQQSIYDRTNLFELAAPAAAHLTGAGPSRASASRQAGPSRASASRKGIRIGKTSAPRADRNARTESVTAPTIHMEGTSVGRTPTRNTFEATTSASRHGIRIGKTSAPRADRNARTESVTAPTIHMEGASVGRTPTRNTFKATTSASRQRIRIGKNSAPRADPNARTESVIAPTIHMEGASVGRTSAKTTLKATTSASRQGIRIGKTSAPRPRADTNARTRSVTAPTVHMEADSAGRTPARTTLEATTSASRQGIRIGKNSAPRADPNARTESVIAPTIHMEGTSVGRTSAKTTPEATTSASHQGIRIGKTSAPRPRVDPNARTELVTAPTVRMENDSAGRTPVRTTLEATTSASRQEIRIGETSAPRADPNARAESVTTPTVHMEGASAGRTPARTTPEVATGLVSPPPLSPERTSAGIISRRASTAKVSVSRPLSEVINDGLSLLLESFSNIPTFQHASVANTLVLTPPPVQITGDGPSSILAERESSKDPLIVTAGTPLQTAAPQNVPETPVALTGTQFISAVEEPSARARSSRDGKPPRQPNQARLEKNAAPSLKLNSRPQSDKEAGPSRSTGHQCPVVTDPGRVKARTLSVPAIRESERVHKIMYNKSGENLIALSGSGQHLVWQWEGSASVEEEPAQVRPSDDMRLINDQPEEGAEPSHCFDFTNNQLYFLSASGGAKLYFYSAERWMQLPEYMENSYSITSLATSPQDNNLVAVGTGTFRIEVIQLSSQQAKNSFEGHRERVTSLEFSQSGELLVSAGADRKVIVWNLNESKMMKSTLLPGRKVFRKETHIQLHEDGLQILAVHESLLAILDIKSLQCLMKWELPFKRAALSHAAFASRGEQIFAGAEDGSVWLFNASNLEPRVRIAPKAYQESYASEFLISSVYAPHPSALAPHPEDQDHVALGMSNGRVILLEVSGEDVEMPEAAEPEDKADKATRKRGPSALKTGPSGKGIKISKKGDAQVLAGCK